MPLVGIIIGGLNFSNLTIQVGEATIKYGTFIENVIDFLIVSACIFFLIKIINKFSKKEEQDENNTKDEKTIILEEIRDLLKEK